MDCGRLDAALPVSFVLPQPVRAAAQEFEEAEVAEDLELLADFGADVAIGGMELG